MGCTSSKENTNLPPEKQIDADDQQLIGEQFRHWFKSNRPQTDDYVLQDLRASGVAADQIDQYRPIVRKALDLLSERQDLKSNEKLSQLLQKEVPSASAKKVQHTIDVLQQIAEKLRHGYIQLPSESTSNGQVETHEQTSSGQPGFVLKEALETARILFYKGKQAAIFANLHGGYDVRILDEHDDVLKENGNLLRSIIVTEVKMRPKSVTPSSPFTAPPPTSSKILNEHEIGDDFRRSIDAALKAIYQPTTEQTVPQPELAISQNDIRPKIVELVDNMNEILVDSIETLTECEIGDPVLDKTVSSTNEPILISSAPLNEEQNNVQSPRHNVTYTEIIHSESPDGEQSRRMKTESYDELPTEDQQSPTTFKVLTKSEFSTDPSSGEKIMEQSVQVISVKVRNETTTTTTNISSKEE